MTIVVTGEALVDLLIDGAGGVTAALGGGPFNTARTVARLGVDVAFAGVLSLDRFGTQLRQRLAIDGVDLSLAPSTDLPTTLAAAELDEHGVATYRFYVDGTSAPALAPFALPSDVTAVHAGTLGLVLEPMATTTEALVAALDTAVLLMVDVNCRPKVVADRVAYARRIERIARRADVVKVSTEDLAYLADADLDVLETGNGERVIAGLFDAGVRVVLHTDGGRPAHLRTPQHDIQVPVPSVTIADTVGAGDAFGGGFLAWWTRRGFGREQLGDVDALTIATIAAVQVAASTCERVGADPPHATMLGRTWIA